MMLDERLTFHSFVASDSTEAISVRAPTLPTLAVCQVGSYLRYTSRDANVVAKAAVTQSSVRQEAGKE